MIISETVETHWNNFTKKWYIEKGYKFTKVGDPVIVKTNDLMPNSTEKVEVECEYCHKRKFISYKDHNRRLNSTNGKYACSECGHIKVDEIHGAKRKEQQYQKLLDIMKERNYIPISSSEEFKNSYTKIRYMCPIHGERTTTYSDMVIQGSGCQLCGYQKTKDGLRLPTEEVKKIVESKNNNILLNAEEYINTLTKNLKVRCGTCGNVFITSLGSIMNSGGRCSKCGHEYEGNLCRLSSDEVERRINSIGNNVLLNKDDYEKSDITNLIIRCSCGETYVTSLANYLYNNVQRCQKCSQRESKGELLIKTILDDLSVKYTTEYKFDDCRDKRPLPFDFYLNDYHMLIEFDGQLHYLPIYGEEKLLTTQYHDEIKNNYCKLYNIPLLRIPYFKASNTYEMIRNFLHS